LLHHGRGPHTRRTDAAKQRTEAYLSGREQQGQMFLVFPACVLTRVLWCRRPGRCLPFFCGHPTRDINQLSRGVRHGGGSSQARRPGADRPLHFPVRAPPVTASPSRFVTFRVHHHMLCQSIDRVREQSRGPAGSCPPPSRLRRRPNFDHVGVNGTYCGEIEKSRLTPRNCNSRLGVHFPGN